MLKLHNMIYLKIKNIIFKIYFLIEQYIRFHQSICAQIHKFHVINLYHRKSTLRTYNKNMSQNN